MDNSMYGHEIKNSSKKMTKSYEYLRVVRQLLRVLNRKGTLFITFPFGQYGNYGFFQQFDSEMLERIKRLLEKVGVVEVNFFKYTKNGWNFVSERDCQKAVSYNPHNGEGRGTDGAAHSRAICCIKFLKGDL
jgi:hypothetical protein